jgi:hypothetical protein
VLAGAGARRPGVTTFEVLLVSHLVGDWLLQTEWMATEKRHNRRALIAHVAVYHLLLLAVLVYRFGYDDVRVYAVVAGLALTHALLDRQWPVLALMRRLRISVERPPDWWLQVAVDQVLHVLLLAVAALVLGADQSR